MTEHLAYILNDVGALSVSASADIDGDGDLDLFVKHLEGSAFYLDSGTAASPLFVLVPGAFPSVRVGRLNQPRFVDVGNPGNWDLLVGRGTNRTFFLRGGDWPCTAILGLPRNQASLSKPRALRTSTSQVTRVLLLQAWTVMEIWTCSLEK